MASFTDEILKFNPYVQQLPVELMMKVGMQKQAQYDAGVQKAQAYIDNIAGLQVARPVDINYLQSKLNNLGGKLKLFASADFSNQQLVNTVGGMTSEIMNDNQIRNAVASTSNLKKQEDIINKAYEKGEWAPENEDLYNDQRNKYLMSTDANASFVNGKYIPYTNVFKKLQDIAESVGVDKSVVSQLFETDSDGNPVMEYIKDKDGNTIPVGFKTNPIATKVTIEGKDIDKVLAAFKTGLTPKDYQQLAITGRYNYKNISPEGLESLIDSSYSNQINSIDSAINKIALNLQTEEGLTSPNMDKVKSLANIYKQLNEQKDSLLSSIDKIKKESISSPEKAEAIKGQIYTDTYLSGIAKTMASQSYEEDKYVSPYFTIMDANRKYDLDLSKFNADQYWKNQNYKLSLAELEIKRKGQELEKAKFIQEFGIDPDTGQAIGIPNEISIDDPGTIGIINNQLDDALTSAITNSEQLAYNLTKEYFKGLPQYANSTDSQIEQAIVKTLKGAGQTMGGGDSVPSVLTQFATQQISKYEKDRNGVPPNFAGLVKGYKESIQKVAYARAAIDNVNQETKELAEQKGIKYTDVKDLEKTAKPTSIDIRNEYGGMDKINLSKQDIVDLGIINAKQSSFLGGLFYTAEDKEAVEDAKYRLTQKFGKNYNKIINSTMGSGESSGFAIPEVQEISGKINASNYKNYYKLRASVIKDQGYLPQGLRVPLVLDSKSKPVISAKLNAVLNKYETFIDNASEITSGLLDGKYQANFIISPKGLGGQNTYSMELTTEKGKVVIPEISESDYTYLSGAVPPSNVGVPSFIRQIDSKGTSNITGTDNPNGGNLFSDSDFINFNSNRYGLTGDIISDKANPNLLFLKMYLHDKLGEERTRPLIYDVPFPKYNQDGSINFQLESLPSGINNNVVEQLLNKKTQR